MISEPQASATPAPVVLCKHCKFFLFNNTAPDCVSMGTCALTPTVTNLVNGEIRHVYCENEREWSGQHCGPDGKNFQPKTP